MHTYTYSITYLSPYERSVKRTHAHTKQKYILFSSLHTNTLIVLYPYIIYFTLHRFHRASFLALTCGQYVKSYLAKRFLLLFFFLYFLPAFPHIFLKNIVIHFLIVLHRIYINW